VVATLVAEVAAPEEEGGGTAVEEEVSIKRKITLIYCIYG
jgi:hypothetical protein